MNSLQIQNTKYIACISNTYLKYLYLKYFTTLRKGYGVFLAVFMIPESSVDRGRGISDRVVSNTRPGGRSRGWHAGQVLCGGRSCQLVENTPKIYRHLGCFSRRNAHFGEDGEHFSRAVVEFFSNRHWFENSIIYITVDSLNKIVWVNCQ